VGLPGTAIGAPFESSAVATTLADTVTPSLEIGKLVVNEYGGVSEPVSETAGCAAPVESVTTAERTPGVTPAGIAVLATPRVIRT
jgi:hypothetical protein